MPLICNGALAKDIKSITAKILNGKRKMKDLNKIIALHSEVEDKGELFTWFGIPDLMTPKADDTQHVID